MNVTQVATGSDISQSFGGKTSFLNVFGGKAGGRLRVNGEVVVGKSIEIRDGRIYADGNLRGEIEREISVVVEGPCESLKASACVVTAKGNVGNLAVSSGSPTIEGDVLGDVEVRAGTITIGGDVGGNAKALAGTVNVRGSAKRGREASASSRRKRARESAPPSSAATAFEDPRSDENQSE